jgi:hypothetical protein
MCIVLLSTIQCLVVALVVYPFLIALPVMASCCTVYVN